MDSQRTTYRRRFEFWLDEYRSDHNQLIEFIHESKQQRAYSRNIRDGLRLVQSLNEGNLDVLLELYPWLADKLQGQRGSDGSGGKIDRLERQIQQLTSAVMSQDNGAMMHSAIQAVPKAKPALTVEKDKTGDAQAISKNLLASF